MTFWSRAVLCLFSIVAHEVNGHGLLWDPPNRSSLWRVDAEAPINYDDNQNFCGGKQIQYEQNGGRCGPCGDNDADARPRANENGGFYGRGAVARTYTANTNIQLQVNITASHLGHFEFNICDLATANPETEACFAVNPVYLLDGTLNYPVYEMDTSSIAHIIYVRLPKDLKCARCVLRWHYWTGNSDGVCDDGSHAIGCGPVQEVFRSCSDISIV